MTKVYLTKWKLRESYPFVTEKYLGRENVEGQIGQPIPAQVPGSVYGALLRANVIENPYYGTNSKRCEWVANRWWCYETEFEKGAFSSESTEKYLIFEGIDNVANVFLNGEKIARFEGANNRQEIKIPRLLQKNKLRVVIESEPMENGQFVYTSRVNTQRNRCGYRWDFCLRLVNMGIYGNVYVEERKIASIENLWVQSELQGNDATVTVRVKPNVYVGVAEEELQISVRYNGREIYREKTKQTFSEGIEVARSFSLKKVKLWYPNGYGEQPLYDVKAQIISKGEVIAEKECLYGFRKIKMLPNDDTSTEARDFLFTVNDKEIFIKGFNYVPIDLMYGEEPEGKLEELLLLVKRSNANMLRVWGGGYIASEKFYQLCSLYGILVWQDFLQSSSGMDNIPNEEESFLGKLSCVSRKAVVSKRNYPCLAVWCGGNELCENLQFKPLTESHSIAKLLQNVIDEEDSGRIFFPSSPYGENFNNEKTGLNQNVHGYYKYYNGEFGIYHHSTYNRFDCNFHAEFGVDGLSALDTLRTILPEKELTVTDSLRSDVWMHLANWWNTLDRDELYFGKLYTLEDYICASQYLQAEGLKYIVECDRRRALQCSGSLIWQLNEPTPNASCTSVIDYFLRPKQAYYAVQQAFQPIVGCARYEKLAYALGEEIRLQFFIINDLQTPTNMRVRIVADDREVLLEKTVATTSIGGRGEELFAFSVKNVFEKGLRVEMVCGEYRNEFLLLSKGNRGYCSLDYVKRQCIWQKKEDAKSVRKD